MAINSWMAPLLGCRLLLQDLHGSDAPLMDVLREIHPSRCRPWGAQFTGAIRIDMKRGMRLPMCLSSEQGLQVWLQRWLPDVPARGYCSSSRTGCWEVACCRERPDTPAAVWLRDIEAELEWLSRTSKSFAERQH